MKIAIFGLGYVGSCTAIALAGEGHQVTGVDPIQAKVDAINNGELVSEEPGLGSLLKKVRARGGIYATTRIDSVIDGTDVGIVCVGTPSRGDGSIDLDIVSRVCEEIGKNILRRSDEEPYLVVIRSTVIPGTTEHVLLPILEKEARSQVGDKFNVVFHPEFLREGSSLDDFLKPPKIVVGHNSEAASRQLLSLYPDKFPGPRIECSYSVAEMAKYSDNLFHALKIGFTNEIDRFCHSFGIHGPSVMEILCSDKKLNISTAYLRPGFAFGGSCLPKDLRAFIATAHSHNIAVPIVENIQASNDIQLQGALRQIREFNPNSIGVYGLTFKPNTDDLRESPAVKLIELLLDGGYEVAIFDPNIKTANLVGQNKLYIDYHISQLDCLLVDELSDFKDVDVAVLTHPIDEDSYAELCQLNCVILDLSTDRRPLKSRI